MSSNKNVGDMTVGSPLRSIVTFAIPLILGYILQQMYLIIDAAIVGRWIGVGALAAVGASASIMFLIPAFLWLYRHIRREAQIDITPWKG